MRNHYKPASLAIPADSTNKCYVFNKGKINNCKKCANKLTKRNIIYKTKKRKAAKYQVSYCNTCNLFYISYGSFLQHANDWTIINPTVMHEYEQQRLEENRAKKARKNKIKNEQRKAVAKASRAKKLTRKQRENVLKLKEHALASHRYVVTNPNEPKENIDLHKPKNELNIMDFVVRRSTFKCLHNEHHVQNIDASIQVIDKRCNIIKPKVAAGFCPHCNIYFIMEHTYQKLKQMGVLQCRVCDEKSYFSNNMFMNKAKFAHESILMQYGYNVSQKEMLTDAQRRKILSGMVDNNLLTRNDIISYLDFFINQHHGQPKFEKAIDKWEADKDFISEYKLGSFAQYGIHALFR